MKIINKGLWNISNMGPISKSKQDLVVTLLHLCGSTLRSRATFNPDTSATHHSRLFVMVRRRKRMNIPHSDITKILRPSTIPYALAAAGCLYISYQFSKRIGEPNESAAKTKEIHETEGTSIRKQHGQLKRLMVKTLMLSET